MKMAFVSTIAVAAITITSIARADDAAKECDAAMKKMQSDMRPMSGDADKDFASMMIPHHQAAVDMARTELQYGKDPVMRKLADKIVSSQEKEIASEWICDPVRCCRQPSSPSAAC